MADIDNNDSREELIPLQKLSISQLNSIKEQIEKELEFFSTSHAQLKHAQQRFSQGQNALTDLMKIQKSRKNALIPLTSSVYVRGYLPENTKSSLQKVKVDIGTGYYVEKTLDEAKIYFQGKLDYLKQQMEMIQKNIYIKQDNLLSITNEMQFKMTATSQQ